MADATDSRLSRLVARLRRINRLFLGLVVAPTALAVLYFGLIAHDVYVSESHFIVRNQQHQSSTGLTGLLQSTGISTADTDTYSVQDYLSSRDALKKLDSEFHLGAAVSRPDIDWLKRFPGPFYDRSFESLLLYYRRNVVETEVDSTSQIVTLTVRAFTADDAVRINESLLAMSEALVNQMNERARNDLVGFARKDVEVAEAQATQAVLAVSAYRNGETVFDPDKQSELQLTRVEAIAQDLLATRKQLADIRGIAAASPQIPVLESRVALLEKTVAAESARVAGGKRSLSSQAAAYAAVQLQQDFTAKHLELALQALQQAREDALKQTLYLERIDEPNRPDIAIEPRRARNILATFILSLIVFGIVSLLSASVKEHAE